MEALGSGKSIRADWFTGVSPCRIYNACVKSPPMARGPTPRCAFEPDRFAYVNAIFIIALALKGRLLMRIAQVPPLIEAVPPKLYGGTERVVAYLTDALVELGHDVTLFASGDSVTKAKLAPIWPRALRLDPAIKDFLAPVFMELEMVARRAHEFDVIHSHLDYFGYPLLRLLDVPSVTTLHGRLDLPELPALYGLYGDLPVVSISK